MKNNVKKWFGLLLMVALFAGVIGLFPVTVRALSSQEVHIHVTSLDADGRVNEYPGGMATVDPKYASPGDWVEVDVQVGSSFRLVSIEWGDGEAVGTDITESKCFQMWDLKEDVYVDVILRQIGPDDPREAWVNTSQFDENGSYISDEEGGYACAVPEFAMPGEKVRIIAVPYSGYYLDRMDW